jgi:hypothetical protein
MWLLRGARRHYPEGRKKEGQMLADRLMKCGFGVILTPLVFGAASARAQSGGDSAVRTSTSPDSASTEPLTCTPAPVVRGERVSCIFRSSDWNVTSWEFTPDTSRGTSAPLPIVREKSTSREWAGIAAIGGVVKVYVTNGRDQRSFQARITVTDRPSPWRSRWSYGRDTMPGEADEPKPPGQEPPPTP